MSVVVADGSPIIALVQIEHIEILPALFGKVFIPPQVHNELRALNRPENVQALANSSPSWLVTRAPSVITPIPGLHLGETAAIQLAPELDAELLLIDEIKGRKMARERGLTFTGTIGVLERAAQNGVIDFADSLERLRKTNFWVSRKLLDEALRRQE